MMNPGEIKNLRLKLNMTQAEFGDLFYKGKSLVSQWESGQKVPTKKVEQAIKNLKEENNE